MSNLVVLKNIESLDKLLESKPEFLQRYDKGKDPLLTPIVKDENAGHSFEFSELENLQKQITGRNNEIGRELSVDLTQPGVRIIRAVRGYIDRFTGKERPTVIEMLKDVAGMMDSGALIAGNLYGTCRKEAKSVMEYMQDNEATIIQVRIDRPGLVEELRKNATSYREIEARLAKVSRDSPQFNILRALARERKDRTLDAYSEIDYGYFVETNLDERILSVESTHGLVKYGSVLARKLYASYHIGADCIKRVGPATNLGNVLFGNPALLYDVITGIKTAVDYAESARTSFMNRELVRKVCKEIGTTPGNGGSCELLDAVRQSLNHVDGRNPEVKKLYGGR
ncbi:hypothetical protein KY363_01725 [Candidatus Woesearchaeota archaeon]|nr:hypothetical protein [Candidatus Woesearchaeota archaeon]